MKFKFFNSADSYGLVNKHFHWIMAVIIIFNFILALILDDFPKGPMRSFLFSIHKSTGILVIILLIPRLLWRLVNTVPVSLGNIKTLNKLSKYVHYFFYFILLVVVFSGWTYSSARSGPFEVFGLFTAPALIENNPSSCKYCKRNSWNFCLYIYYSFRNSCSCQSSSSLCF